MAAKAYVNETVSLYSNVNNADDQSSMISVTDNVDKLKVLLRKESEYHKETGNCYDTLQREYDELLKKYAEAENTIDQYRIATELKLYSDKSIPNLSSKNLYKESRCKSVQQINSKQQHSTLIRAASLPETSLYESDVKSVQQELKSVLNELQNDVFAFEGALVDNEYLYEEKIQIYNALKNEFDDVMKKFQVLQKDNDSKGSSLKESKSRFSEEFFDEDSFEGELYRLGLRLEEISDEISEQRNRTETFTSFKGINTIDDVFTNQQEKDGEINSLLHSKNCKHTEKVKENVVTETEQTVSPSNIQFDEQYLSQSLQPPTNQNNSDPAMVDSHTEAAYYNKWSSDIANHRSPSTISDKQNYSRLTPNKRTKKLLRHEDATVVVDRPSTMNSTKDSGFLELEKEVDTNNNSTLYQCSNSLGRHNNRISVSDGNENHADKLNSLRHFLNHNRNNLEESSSTNSSHSSISSLKSTPRSWVRGISTRTPVNLRPSFEGDYEEGRAYENKIVNGPHQRSYSTESINRRVTNAHSNHRVSVDRRSQSSENVIMDRQQLTPCCSLEDLQEEMYSIKNLIVDIRESLSINQPNLPSQHSFKSPAVSSKPDITLPPWKTKKSYGKEVGMSKQENGNHVDLEQIQLQHLKLLKQLTNKIDVLSSKVDAADRKISDTSNNANVESLDSPSTSSNENPVNQKFLVLDSLAERIDNLSNKLKATKTDESEKDITKKETAHEKIIKKIENKLDELNQHMQDQDKETLSQPRSNVSHSYPCPICRGMNTHRHGGYLHAGLDVDLTNPVTDLDVPNHFNGPDDVFSRQNSRIYGNQRNSSSKSSTRRDEYFHEVFNRHADEREMTGANNILQEHNSPTAPLVFHHYHSAYPINPCKKSSNPMSKSVTRDKVAKDGALNVFYDDPGVQRSINNASMAAMNMEYISKRMLNTIATDLFNSGASEY